MPPLFSISIWVFSRNYQQYLQVLLFFASILFIKIHPLPKPFNSPFLQNQFCIKKKKKQLWLMLRRKFFQMTISLHNITNKLLLPKSIYWSQNLIGGPHLPGLPNDIPWLLLAYHWAMILPTPIRACRARVLRHFTNLLLLLLLLLPVLLPAGAGKNCR